MPVVMLLLSLLLAAIPLAGIVWIMVNGSILNMDGLFTTLILLALAGIFFLNAAWELRDRGLLPFFRKEKATTKSPPGPKSE